MMRRLAALAATAALGASLLTTTVATTAGAAAKNAMTVTMRDYAFVVDGTLRPGQASVTVKNAGKEPHILAMFKLKPGATLKQLKAATKKQDFEAFSKLTSDPDGAYGIPFFLTPGGAGTSITNLFSPGKYVMICFLSDAKGTPHVAHGMIQLVTISGKPVKPTPVESNGTVTITDDSITTPPSPAPSDVTVKVDNQGTTLHSLVIVKLNGDATMPDVNSFFNDFEGGPLPADVPGEVVSGVGDIKPGKSVYLTWKNLEPGRYGYASISGGDENGQGDDFSKGMYGEFTIA